MKIMGMGILVATTLATAAVLLMEIILQIRAMAVVLIMGIVVPILAMEIQIPVRAMVVPIRVMEIQIPTQATAVQILVMAIITLVAIHLAAMAINKTTMATITAKRSKMEEMDQ